MATPTEKNENHALGACCRELTMGLSRFTQSLVRVAAIWAPIGNARRVIDPFEFLNGHEVPRGVLAIRCRHMTRACSFAASPWRTRGSLLWSVKPPQRS